MMVPDMFQEQLGDSSRIQGGDCGYGMNLFRQAICQGTSKTRSILNIQVPVELQCICKGSLKGNGSLLNAWAEML